MTTHTESPVSAPQLADAFDGAVKIASFVADLAAARGIAATPSPLDRFAADVSRLSDAEVTPDRTEDLISALVHAGILSPVDGLQLQQRHLKQTTA